MSNNQLTLKPINDLLGESFFIPAYQRGYRWTERQVTELLDDIWEFGRPQQKDCKNNDADFYCLQPIVVVRGKDNWQVVDGQQRLTTMYLILHYLEKEHLRRPLMDAYKKNLYSISYETRPTCEDFLKDVQANQSHENIDFFHISQAYQSIQKWFSDKDYNDNNELLSVLLAKSPDKRSVKVIWYDLTEECANTQYAVDVFSRINIGKIPLTNAELVKALFLKSGNFGNSQAKLMQIQIASEWDAIEKRLHEPSFWYFIKSSSKDSQYSTRIEYIFDLIQNKTTGAEAFYTFHKFNEDFKSPNFDVDHAWKQIKKYMLTFEEWYQDRELYHLIGFLIDCGVSVKDIKKESQQTGRTKAEFKLHLKNKIKEILKKIQIDHLTYSDNRADIRKILLLLNIQTLLSSKEADVRFPFDRYKIESWDIEHIHSQTNTPLTGDNRKLWLKDVKNFLSNQHISNEIDCVKVFTNQINDFLSHPTIEDSVFNKLYTELFDHFGCIDADSIDKLGNLTLLDSSTNRSYKNALFPMKRLRIIENDKHGIFVPVCTKNVFLKYYSLSSNNLMSWRDSDAQEYFNAISATLEQYLPNQGDRNDSN